MQPTQLSLLPDHVPAPPPTVLGLLPQPKVQVAIGLLARLIANAAVCARTVGAMEAADE